MPAARMAQADTSLVATIAAATSAAAELARLAALDRDGFMAAWVAAFRVPVPQSASRAFLLKAVAHHAQVKAARAVRPAVRKALLQLGRASRDGMPAALPPAAPSLKPGARLIRAFRGETHEVTVTADGRFEWRGRRHRSLSRIATAITGSRRNGRPSSVCARRRKWRKRLGALRRDHHRVLRRRHHEPASRKAPRSAQAVAIRCRHAASHGWAALRHLHPQVERGGSRAGFQLAACPAGGLRGYVASQRHEGWRVLPEAYDDDGVSGGTLERPVLKLLLAAVEASAVDVVVVYKVDRLTRSLADFAKIVEVFDAESVSFVSVTQQFNTTSSMGRLTLNVLLSFAQFEREVTGDRIRDKIAASKRKGLWMGGHVPLGYRANERTLAIDEAEAETVRRIFDLYRERGNVRLVKAEADRLGLRSKRREGPDGTASGGVSFTRGAIYKLLSNPVYAGDIVHRGTRHRGQHPAIVAPAEFAAVQRGLTSGAMRARGQGAALSPSLLAGLIVDEAGQPLTPTHANKKGRRYRYYVSRELIGDAQASAAAAPQRQRADAQGWRLPAGEIETLVLDALRELLIDQGRLMDRFGLGLLRPDDLDLALKAGADLADALASASAREQRALLENLLARIVIAAERVVLIIRRQALWNELGAVDPKPDDASDRDLAVELTIAIRLARRGAELKLVLGDRQQPRRDRSLIGKLAQGFLWFEELRTGAVASLGEIAQREGIATVMVRRACDLAFLSTDLIEAILAGDQPVELNSEAVKVAYPLPIAWEEQRRVLGFA